MEFSKWNTFKKDHCFQDSSPPHRQLATWNESEFTYCQGIDKNIQTVHFRCLTNIKLTQVQLPIKWSTLNFKVPNNKKIHLKHFIDSISFGL